MLVPEIALTPQIVARFVERFGDTVAVLHSKLSKGERYDEWQRLRRGEARVCVGPRSAVFAPIADLGLIVIDEEHDPSYKHEGDPRYDARHVAERRGATRRLRVGDAAAGVGARAAARPAARARRRPRAAAGRRARHARRRARRCTPTPSRACTTRARRSCMLNRRGWSNFLTCRSCGHVWMCPDVRRLARAAPRPRACSPATTAATARACRDECPECRSVSVARHGAGTERLEAELGDGRACRVWRLDADVAAARPRCCARSRRRRRGVLVGTQMVAKGHDFPDVTLGVVLDADATLRFPDFRAEERTFALVAQLAGRAGPRSRRRPRARADARPRRAVDPRRGPARRRRLPRRRARAPRASCATRRSRRSCGSSARPRAGRRRRRGGRRPRRARPAARRRARPGAAVPPAQPRARAARRQGEPENARAPSRRSAARSSRSPRPRRTAPRSASTSIRSSRRV